LAQHFDSDSLDQRRRILAKRLLLHDPEAFWTYTPLLLLRNRVKEQLAADIIDHIRGIIPGGASQSVGNVRPTVNI